jgi:hypothetical protein
MESVAPDRQDRPTDCPNFVFLRPRPSCPTSLYRCPLPTTSYHFSPHIKRLPKLVKQNRSALPIFLEKLFQEGLPDSTATCGVLLASSSPHLAAPFRLLFVHCSSIVMHRVSLPPISCSHVLHPMLCSFCSTYTKESLTMEWTAPQHEEIDLNCEISSYANAEI